MSTDQVAPAEDVRLNDEQREAVEHSDGPLAVLAGPGTGKTRVIVNRIARLVENGAEPESILGLTFSVKAAQEMQDRLIERLGPRVGSRLVLSTFHGWGRRFLARFGDVIGHRVSPTIMDSAQTHRLLGELIVARDLFTGFRGAGMERAIEIGSGFIERSIHAGREGEEAQKFAQTMLDQDLGEMDPDDRVRAEVNAALFRDGADLYAAYERECAERGIIGIGDYVMAPVRILRRDEKIRAITRSEVRHVVVDEFQDVNLAQLALLELLCPPERSRDLCVVGDDDQAIYGFRGSDDRAFARFASIWEEHEVRPLVTNYRSSKSIVDLSSGFIKLSNDRFAPEKEIAAHDASPGDPVVCVECDDEEQFGLVIAAMIREQMGRDATLGHRDFAVIGPSHTSLAKAESELAVAGIPTVRGRQRSVLDDEAVSDLFAWMRLVSEGVAVSDVLRLIRRPLFGVRSEEINAWALEWNREASSSRRKGETPEAFVDWLARTQAGDGRVARFTDCVRRLRDRSMELSAGAMAIEIVRSCHVVESTSVEPRERAERVRAVARVLRFVRSCEPAVADEGSTLAAFLAHYDRLQRTEQEQAFVDEDRVDGSGDEGGDDEDAVHLITAHASKGLEFRTVFVIKVSPRGFPATNRAETADIEYPVEYLNAEPPNREAEQRRLFYVAMTRAEERLVLLAKRKKKRGKTIDYFFEVREDLEGVSVVSFDAGEIIANDRTLAAGDAVDVHIAHEGEDAALSERVRRRERALRLELVQLSYDATRPSETERLELIATRSAEIVRQLASVADEATPHPSVDAPAYPGLQAPLDLSYTKIEDYLRCPRCFCAKHVLGFPGDPSGAMRVGVVVHDALERFFLDVQEFDTGEGGEGRTAPGEDELLGYGRAIFDARCRLMGGGDAEATVAAEALEWDRIAALLRHAIHRLHDASANIMALEQRIAPVPLVVGEHAHRLTAKIDRIDQFETPSGLGYRIIDYKTGRPSKATTEPKADDMQLGLYLKALMWHFGMEERPAGGAEYWVLQSGERGVLDFEDLDMEAIDARIEQAVEGMLAGRWEQGKTCDCAGMGEFIAE